MKNKVLLIVLLGFVACKDEGPKDKGRVSTEEKAPDTVILKNTNVPEFNADSAYNFVKKQVDFGPRVPNSKAHDKAADYFINTFKRYGLTVDVQKGEVKAFNNEKLRIQNIFASINPEKTKRILITAHWDTRPFADQDKERKGEPIAGANDGGSGVAVILELARVMSVQKPDIGIDFLLFDAEDYGQPDGTMYPQQQDSYCLGSQFWCKSKAGDYHPEYAINLDMVGAKDAKFTMEGTSMRFAPSVVRKVWDIGNKIGYSKYFIYRQTPPITDDHAYVNVLANIPAIDIIEYDETTASNFSSSWHTHNDNMDVIDRNTLKAVGQTLLTVIFNED